MKRFDWPRIVAAWQIAGAAISVVSFLDTLPQRGLLTAVCLVMLIVLCVVAVLAGRALLERRREGRRVSLLIWVLQVPSFAVGGVQYGLTLGPYAYVGLFPNGVAGISAGFTPHFALRWHASPPSFATFGINVLALIALAVIWRTTSGSTVRASLAPAA